MTAARRRPGQPHAGPGHHHLGGLAGARVRRGREHRAAGGCRPSGSALEWSDLAAMDPRLAPPQDASPFRIVALPSCDLHRRVPEIAGPDDVVIIDVPQLEDHAGIARSALRYASEIVIPCTPSPIEINGTTPVRDEIAEVEAARDAPARSGKVTPCLPPGARRLCRVIFAESRAGPAGCCGEVSSRAWWSTLTSPSRPKTSGPRS